MFSSKSDQPKGQWITELPKHTPYSSTIDKRAQILQTLVGTGHTSHDSSPMDLSSLHVLVQKQHGDCYKSNANCGPYLYPLTNSDGATFGKPAPYASTYLSWMVYLTDDLQSQFQNLLDEFKNIDCTNTGCTAKSGVTHACTSHAPGTHGTSDTCSCNSVVHCGGVLPLPYRYGFTFSSTGALFGEGRSNSNTKRQCHQFSEQLENVLNGDPLTTLLITIDAFLYAIRCEFFSKLSGFWSIYVCLILYTFFFLLDTLHLRSHLKLTSSHSVPPLALLTSGKLLPVTKLTYIGQ